jgi:hypothetical protein
MSTSSLTIEFGVRNNMVYRVPSPVEDRRLITLGFIKNLLLDRGILNNPSTSFKLQWIDDENEVITIGSENGLRDAVISMKSSTVHFMVKVGADHQEGKQYFPLIRSHLIIFLWFVIIFLYHHKWNCLIRSNVGK